MNAWMDGLSVLTDEWRLVIVSLIFVLSCQSLTGLFLRKFIEDRLSRAESLALGLAGWTLPASIISLIWYLTGFEWIIWIPSAALILVLLVRLYAGPGPVAVSGSFCLLLFLLLSILLRLAYVSRATFPMYFDSAQHYSVTRIILTRDWAHLLGWLSTGYYHTGFHFLTAFFASVSGSGITQVMLILGQIILAMIPFSVFFLVRYETGSDTAGWFALFLAAFGWYMPAHAVDWGKYPALMSLGMIPFVLSVAYLLSKNRDLSHGKRWFIHAVWGISLLLSGFAHSRSLIVLGIVLLAWVTATWLENRTQRLMPFAFILVVIVMIALVALILGQNILALLFDPYLSKGILITALVLLLSIFAWMTHPRLTFVCVLTMALILASLFVPVTWMPGYRNLTLLDRPFVEMILFLPLSMLGGLGLAGLTRKLRGRYMWGGYIGILAGGIVIINAFLTYNLYPSDCCAIVGKDDVVAMDWVADQLPVDARVGIASAQLKVLPAEIFEGNVGADAGIWITPLTGRVTIPLAYDTDFSQRSMLEQLCESEVGYLFAGEAGQPFDTDKIETHPEWYRPLLSMPKTGVYEVTGCD